MLRKYDIIGGKGVEVFEGDASILKYISPDRDEIAEIVANHGIDEHNLNSALDPDELGRLEFDEDTGHVTLIFKRPRHHGVQGAAGEFSQFGIGSVGIILTGTRMIIIQEEDADLIEDRLNARLQSHHDVLLRILYSTINHFRAHLKAIHAYTDALEDKIAGSTENRYLLAMFALEKSLVYYLNAATSNMRLFRKMQVSASKFGFSEEHLEILDDISIEAEQCMKQMEIYSTILGSLMETCGSIVNNNLNLLIKTLTTISIVFMPINVLASVGGMSEFTMMTLGIPWPIAYAAFMVGLAAIGFVTYLLIRNMGSERQETKVGGRFFPSFGRGWGLMGRDK